LDEHVATETVGTTDVTDLEVSVRNLSTHGWKPTYRERGGSRSVDLERREALAASGARRCSSCRIELQISMHSLQLSTPGGPAMSDATWWRRFSQNAQRSTWRPRPVEEVMLRF
jgi:hypothetical protein